MDDQRTDRKGGGVMRLFRLVALTIIGGLLAYAVMPPEPLRDEDMLAYSKTIVIYVSLGSICGLVVESLIRWRERKNDNPTH